MEQRLNQDTGDKVVAVELRNATLANTLENARADLRNAMSAMELHNMPVCCICGGGSFVLDSETSPDLRIDMTCCPSSNNSGALQATRSVHHVSPCTHEANALTSLCHITSSGLPVRGAMQKLKSLFPPPILASFLASFLAPGLLGQMG